MPTVHSTGQFAELLWPGIAKIYGKEYNRYDILYKKFFQLEDSGKAFEKDQQVTGFPRASVKDEGNEAVFEQMFQGLQTEYRHITYSIGAVITREMYEDDQYNVMTKIPSCLAQSMVETEEIVAHNVLNNGFNATIQPGSDGVGLFSTAHPLTGGGTLSNTPATPADLTLTSLENDIIAIMDFTDDQGLRIGAKPKQLIVPTALSFTAHKLLESQYVPGSADNDRNIITNLGIEPVVTPYLTDDDAYFIGTDVRDGLKFFVRREAEIDRDNDFETDNLKIKTTKRFATGFTDFRGVYGNPGA